MPKKSKADKDFDKVIKEFSVDNETLKTSKAQFTSFFIHATLVAAIPFALYGFILHESGALLENLLYFVIGIIVNGALLAHAYEFVSSRMRKNTYSASVHDTSLDESGEESRKALAKFSHSHGASYAYFIVNTTYMLGYLFMAFYALRSASLSSPIHFVSCTIPSALVALGLSKVKAF